MDDNNITIEPTEVEAWIQCPRKWYFSYKLNLINKKFNENLSFGRLMHTALQTYHTEGLSRMTEVYNNGEKQMRLENPSQKLDKILNDGRSVLLEYVNWEEIKNLEFEMIEQPFEIEIDFEGITVAGRIDGLARRKNLGDLTVVDWKTAKSFMSEFLKKMSRQMYQYVWAFNQIMNEPVPTASYVELRKVSPSRARTPVLRLTEIQYTPKMLAYFYLNVLLPTLRDIRDQYYEEEIPPARPTHKCNFMCDFRKICEPADVGDPIDSIVDTYYTKRCTPNYLEEGDEDE